MDRSSLRKRNIGSKPAAEAVARSGSVAANKDNLIQAKAQQNLISQSPPSQLLAINRSAMGDKNSSTRLIQSKVNPPKRAPSESATHSSNQSVGSLQQIAQLRRESGFPVIQKEDDPYAYDKAEVMKEDKPNKIASGLETASDVGGLGMEAYGIPDSITGAIDEDKKAADRKAKVLSSDLIEWSEDGAGNLTKRTKKQQIEYLKEEHIKEGVKDPDKDKEAEKIIKEQKEKEAPGAAQDAVKKAITGSIGTALSFMKLPSMWGKFKKAENNYEKFGIALEGAETLNKGVQSGAEIADAASGATNQAAQDTAKISEYTGGVIGLIKNGWNSCMNLKQAYEDYKFIKDNQEGDESKLEGARVFLNETLATTSGVLANIHSYQKGFGTFIDKGVADAVPAISIVTGTISLIERIITIVRNRKFDFGSTAEQSQTASILSELSNKKNRDKAKTILQTDKFRDAVKAAAGYKQQARDNPEVFAKFEASLKDEKIKANLKRNFPRNYARIEEIHTETSKSPKDVSGQVAELIGLGMSEDTWNRIVDDQTVINQLEEIKGKRTKNAAIGIFTDLVNIGSDIASLSGAGAVVGASMKAGTAAIDASRKAGNMIKSAARSSGAEEFAAGAESKRWLNRSSLADRTDILKSTKAKEERYFATASMILNSIADHDKGYETRTTDQNAESYKWAQAKVLGTGASVSMIKAMLNSGKKTGNDIVKYMMDKLKVR